MKRMFDLLLASLLFIIFLVPMLIVALLVRLLLGSPIIFKQPRLGYAEKCFNIYKFRTMSEAKDKEGRLLSDSQRLTKLGGFLRKTSLDELPQLWNILKGDMSFIGPRPLFVEYLPYYTQLEKKRHTVRPGITGLAQVSGRNRLLWDERLALDVKYVEQRSFMLDLKIFWLTFLKVIKRDDIDIIPGLRQGTLIQCRTQEDK